VRRSNKYAAAVGDLIARVAFAAIGALLIHDAVWWANSWFFGRPMGGWWKRQSLMAQTLYRIWLGMFGLLIVVTAIFGTVLHP
jgi:hypothetical protein